MGFPFGVTATFIPQTTDKFGDRIAGTPVEVDGCAFWEVLGAQTVGAQDTEVYTALLLAPFDTVCHTTDRVTVYDVTYEVVSEPIPWLSVFTNWKPNVQVQLRRVDG